MTRSSISQALVIITQGIFAPPRGDSLTKPPTQRSELSQLAEDGPRDHPETSVWPTNGCTPQRAKPSPRNGFSSPPGGTRTPNLLIR